jgi:hypothetical protein
MDEATRRRLFLLPPLKKSHDKLLVTSKAPIIIENNFMKEKSFLELSVDKFSILTNQPKKIEKFKLTTKPTSAKYVNELSVKTTPMSFKWDTNNMPQIKVTIPSKVPKSLTEKSSEKRMRLLFQQKLALDRINSEKRERLVRSQELMSRSTETLKSVKEKQKKRRVSTTLETEHKSKAPDLWASTKYQDINLKSQIINHFYSLDNRHIRFFRKTRPNYYEFTANQNFERILNNSKSFDNCNRIEAV